MILHNSREFAMNHKIWKQYEWDGRLGKTSKFWIMYLELMKLKHMEHTLVQENDLKMRSHAWKGILPVYFYFKKTNHARYETYYFQHFKRLETLEPALKLLLQAKGVGVSKHPLINKENKQLIVEMLKLQVRYLILGNVSKIETFKLSTVSFFHRFNLLWMVIFMD